jgi:hypothetical protein
MCLRDRPKVKTSLYGSLNEERALTNSTGVTNETKARESITMSRSLRVMKAPVKTFTPPLLVWKMENWFKNVQRMNATTKTGAMILSLPKILSLSEVIEHNISKIDVNTITSEISVNMKANAKANMKNMIFVLGSNLANSFHPLFD